MTLESLQSLSVSKATQALQALADGVPPNNEIANWLTIGQEKLISLFERSLSTAAIGGFETLLLLGDPGAGKSHALSALEQIAQNNGFLTSSFSQDPQSRIGFNRPDQLYKKLIESLRLKGEKQKQKDPIQEILDKWATLCSPVVNSTNPSLAIGYKLADLKLLPPIKETHVRTNIALISYLLASQKGDEEARITFLNILKGPGVSNTTLIETAANLNFFYPYRVGYTPSNYDEKYYFGQLKVLVFILRTVGYKGLVILFDEVTSIVNLNSRSREKSYKVLDSLFFNEQGYNGVCTIFTYLPAFINQLRKDSYLLSTGDLIKKWTPLWENSMYQVEPLNSKQMFDLAKRLADIHSIAWEWDAWPAVANTARAWIRDSEWKKYSVREFVRGMVQRFDQYKDEH